MDETAAIRKYLSENAPLIKHADLADDAPLVSSGLLDSISRLQLILFIEKNFGVEITSADATDENLETIRAIVRLVRSKRR